MYLSMLTISYYMCDMSLAGCALAVMCGHVDIVKLNISYGTVQILLYHHILLLIILQYVASV